MNDIPNKIRSTLGIVCDVSLHHEGGLPYIAIEVDPSPFPISCNGEYHYRSGATKQQLKGNELTRFIFEKTGMSWESVPMEGLSVADFRHDAFDIFRERALRAGRIGDADADASNEDLMRAMRLVTEDGKVTRAGALLFHQEPQRWVPYATTRIGYFASDADVCFRQEHYEHFAVFILNASTAIVLTVLSFRIEQPAGLPDPIPTYLDTTPEPVRCRGVFPSPRASAAFQRSGAILGPRGAFVGACAPRARRTGGLPGPRVRRTSPPMAQLGERLERDLPVPVVRRLRRGQPGLAAEPHVLVGRDALPAAELCAELVDRRVAGEEFVEQGHRANALFRSLALGDVERALTQHLSLPSPA